MKHEEPAEGHCARSDVFKAAKIQIKVFWVVMPREDGGSIIL